LIKAEATTRTGNYFPAAVSITYMTKTVMPLVLCLLVTAAGGPARAADPAQEMKDRGAALVRRLEQGQPITVIAFGDSLTAGLGTDGRHFFPRLFADDLAYRFPESHIRLLVQGHSGETTAGALWRVDDEVIKEKPDLVLVEFGGNDKGSNRSVDAFRADYARLLNKLATQTSALVIACLNPIIDDDPHNAWNDAFREVAAAAGVPAADLDAAIRRGDHDFRGPFPAGNHPGDFTHVIFAREIVRAFDEATRVTPAFSCSLDGGCTLSNEPAYDLRADLRNLTVGPLDCATMIDFPAELRGQDLRAQPGDNLIHVPIPLREGPARSYSLPVHLWARGANYGSFDTRWLVVAPAIAATPAASDGTPTAPISWHNFGPEDLMFGSQLWLGPRDLGGRFSVLAMPHRLRFAIMVTDDDISVSDLSNPAAGDSVELYLDLRNEADQGKPVYSADVLVLQIIAPTAPGQPAQWKAMAPLPKDLQWIAVQTQPTSDGYAVQVDVPLDPIQARRGEDWSGLGFDIGLNDANTGGYRKCQMMWAGIPNNYLNPAYFAGLYRDRVPPGSTRRTLR
jgi:lysophospholipase L1-like esterase